MEYHAPQSLAEVTDLLQAAGGRARLLAGGTDLLVKIRETGLWPQVLIDLKRVPDLTALTWRSGGEWIIGAAVTCAALRADDHFAQDWPGVAEAVSLVGAVQTQNRATLGGNICNASPAADILPALVAARATCRVVGPNAERTLAVEEVIVAPGRTCLRSDEVLVSIRLPAREGAAADAYQRITPRTGMDIAMASAAVNIMLDTEGAISECHVALGGVFPVPMLVAGAGRHLFGVQLRDDMEVLARFRRQVSAACRPIDDARGTAEYRSEVVGVLAVRAARHAWRRAWDGSRGDDGKGDERMVTRGGHADG